MNTSFFLVNDRYKFKGKPESVVPSGLQIFLNSYPMLLREPEGRDDREGDDNTGDKETILQGVVLGELCLIVFAQIVGIDQLVEHSKDGDADRAAQLLEEAVHGGGGGRLFDR